MDKKTKKILSRTALIAVFPGILWAFLVAKGAIEHNPMGEFFTGLETNDLDYDLKKLGLLWMGWFSAVFLPLWGALFFLGFFLIDRENLKETVLGKKINQIGNLKTWTLIFSFSSVLSTILASLLILTTFDPGHYDKEFCLNRYAKICQPDYPEIVAFWGFWFAIPFILLMGLFAWNWFWEKNK